MQSEGRGRRGRGLAAAAARSRVWMYGARAAPAPDASGSGCSCRGGPRAPVGVPARRVSCTSPGWEPALCFCSEPCFCHCWPVSPPRTGGGGAELGFEKRGSPGGWKGLGEVGWAVGEVERLAGGARGPGVGDAPYAVATRCTGARGGVCCEFSPPDPRVCSSVARSRRLPSSAESFFLEEQRPPIP